MPTRYTSSDDTHAMVARIALSILERLATAYRAAGEPSSPPWPSLSKEEVELTLMRLAVTGRILAAGGKYTLSPATSQSRADHQQCGL